MLFSSVQNKTLFITVQQRTADLAKSLSNELVSTLDIGLLTKSIVNCTSVVGAMALQYVAYGTGFS